jgi:hypothetical protein
MAWIHKFHLENMHKITFNKGLQAMSSVYMPFIFSTVTSYALNQFAYQREDRTEMIPKNNNKQDVHLKATKAFFSSVTSDIICSDFKSNFIVYKGCSWIVKEFLGNGIDYSISLFYSHDDHGTIDSI